MKWSGNHRNESTWEPEYHAADAAAYEFECAVQKRLSTRSSSVIVNFDLDIYRHVFETDQAVIIENTTQLERLPLCGNCDYKLNLKVRRPQKLLLV